MRFTELVDSGASKMKQHEYLVGDNQTSITICIPSNFKDAAESVALKSLDFSVFARVCMIDELVKEDSRWNS